MRTWLLISSFVTVVSACVVATPAPQGPQPAPEVVSAALDPEVPATLSKPVITDLLRGELGHAGVVISDDMHMGAIVDNYSLDDALRRALAAGVDLLILGNNARYSPDTAAQAIDVIAEHVAQGRLPRATIEAAHARVTALKERLAAPPAERSQG